MSTSSIKQGEVTDVTLAELRADEFTVSSSDADTIQIIEMSTFSDEIWSITPPSLEDLLNALTDSPSESPVQLMLQVEFSREETSFNWKSLSLDTTPITLNERERMELSSIINQTVFNAAETTSTRTLEVALNTRNELWPRSIELPARSQPIVVREAPIDSSVLLMIFTTMCVCVYVCMCMCMCVHLQRGYSSASLVVLYNPSAPAFWGLRFENGNGYTFTTASNRVINVSALYCRIFDLMFGSTTTTICLYIESADTNATALLMRSTLCRRVLSHRSLIH